MLPSNATSAVGLIIIGVAMQPEAIVAATLAVSQERKSFTTNHTSILNIVQFNAQNVAQFDALRSHSFKISVGETNTHTHTQNDYCNPRCAFAPRVNYGHNYNFYSCFVEFREYFRSHIL